MQYLKWTPVSEGLPSQEEYREYLDRYYSDPEFIVFIYDALLPTVLSFDGTGFYWEGPDDSDRDYYQITHWMKMPPKPEDCLIAVTDFGEFKPEYEALEVLL